MKTNTLCVQCSHIRVHQNVFYIRNYLVCCTCVSIAIDCMKASLQLSYVVIQYNILNSAHKT